ncbi:lantibiotic dehydratase [Streptomyces cinerochromogenes]|uniref:Lantibiotic dehydratase n=1 Tax=Streptomyces cinerochromogenes TaxID=66422 RepID=A0ABW7B5X2_9ACTN
MTGAPDYWPDPNRAAECQLWIREIWQRQELADAVRSASPSLASTLDRIAAGDSIDTRKVRRAAASLMRYTIRSVGRSTPHGLFAGVAPVSVGSASMVRLGEENDPKVRVDAEWLADIIGRLEVMPELLRRLDLVFNTLVMKRGNRIEVSHESSGFSVRDSELMRVVREVATSPVHFPTLVHNVCSAFPDATPNKVASLLGQLTQHGFLLTSLRAPMTIPDSLPFVIDQLDRVAGYEIPSVAAILNELKKIAGAISRHNRSSLHRNERSRIRRFLTRRLHALSEAGQVPLRIDMLLDGSAVIPNDVAGEIERAASVLCRLSHESPENAAWRAYHAAFYARYGSGALVPLLDVVDPSTGLGYPPGYPGSYMPQPLERGDSRISRLLGLAWEAINSGSHEILLTDRDVDVLTEDVGAVPTDLPAHLEVSARIQAESVDALDHGNFRLTLTPARSVGTLTSRFAHLMTGSGLETVYQRVPPATAGALPVQLSMRPIHSRSENVCRISQYLPRVLSLGEHRTVQPRTVADQPDPQRAETEPITIDDLAVTASTDSLHLVSIPNRRIIEPQVFHALVLDAQVTPLVRFIAEISRASANTSLSFDWGPYAERLAFLPRIRYGRSVLSPARWSLPSTDLPSNGASSEEWDAALTTWRSRWHCPASVELIDGDRTLRLDLMQAGHCYLLRKHLQRHSHATLVEDMLHPGKCGWINGHAHEVVLPLYRRSQPRDIPQVSLLPLLRRGENYHLPGSPAAHWLYAKVLVHPVRQQELITEHLPNLAGSLSGNPKWWIVRYLDTKGRNQIRLRIATQPESFGAYASSVSEWAESLMQAGIIGGLSFDTYRPEIGRYGCGAALAAAEEVFAADTALVVAETQRLEDLGLPAVVLTALNFAGIAQGFLGGHEAAIEWLASRPARKGRAINRSARDHAIRLARPSGLGYPFRDCPEIMAAWQARANALAAYRETLPDDFNIDNVLESLLHMHHNRSWGPNRAKERDCLRLSRQTAIALQSEHRTTGEMLRK